MRSGWVFALIYMYNYEIVLKYAVYGTVDQIAQEEGPPWSPTDLAFSSPPLKVPAHVVSKSTPGVILLFKQKIRCMAYYYYYFIVKITKTRTGECLVWSVQK